MRWLDLMGGVAGFELVGPTWALVNDGPPIGLHRVFFAATTATRTRL